MSTIAITKKIEDKISITKPKTGLRSRVFGDLESKRFGIMPALLIWTVCWSSVAVGLGAMDSVFLLTLLTFPTMAVLTFCLAVQPMRSIVTLSVGATLISWGVILSLLI